MGRTVKWLVGVGFLYAVLSPVVALPIFLGTLLVTGSLLAGLAAVLGFALLIAAVPVGLDRLWTTQYAVTDRRVLVYTGRLGESVDSVPLARVRDAEHDGGALASLLGVWRVTVDTDAEAEHLTFDLVASPARVAQRVTRAADAAGSPSE